MMMAEFQELFKHGNTVNSFGDSVLHYAAALGRMDVVRWLCSQNAEMNAKNSHGWTPTDSAFFNSHEPVVQFLQSAGGQLIYFKDDIKSK